MQKPTKAQNNETLKREILRHYSARCGDIEIAALLGKSAATIKRVRERMGLPGLWGRPKNDFQGKAHETKSDDVE